MGMSAWPLIYLARHGETAWTVTGQHTGRTDLTLTARGEENARRLGERLGSVLFEAVLVSPLRRAIRTCELAGYAAAAMIDHDLVEWDYGAYEGRTGAEIRRARPEWEIFRDGCPDGESVAEVMKRADRVVERLSVLDGNALIFSHSHFLRLLTARWLGLEAGAARCFFLGTAALSILGHERGPHDAVIRLWNDCAHVGEVG